MEKEFRKLASHGFMYEIDKIKGSRFWGIVFCVEDKAAVKKCLDEVSMRYPDSDHICYAYRIGDLAQSSDAGEPAGTAGRPIAHVLEQSGLDAVLVVVLRHFGGTLLGAGGLVRAYSRCATALLEQVPYTQQDVWTELSLQFSYEYMGTVISLVEQFDAEVLGQEDGLLATMHIRVNRGLYADFCRSLQDRTAGQVRC